MKKLVGLFLVAVMIMGMLPLVVSAAEPVSSGAAAEVEDESVPEEIPDSSEVLPDEPEDGQVDDGEIAVQTPPPGQSDESQADSEIDYESIPEESVAEAKVTPAATYTGNPVMSFSALQAAIATFNAGVSDMVIEIGASFVFTESLKISNTSEKALTIRSAASAVEPYILARGFQGSTLVEGMLDVHSGAKLILENIIIDGMKDIYDADAGSLVIVRAGALTLADGGVLQNSCGYGAGVLIWGGNTFTMTGGKISGNTDLGVEINDSIFVMSGGEISNNTGGGVHVGYGHNLTGTGSTFEMTGGSICGNSPSLFRPAGVTVWRGSQFTMSGTAAINSNNGTAVGGYGVFNMLGGEICNNAGYGVEFTGAEVSSADANSVSSCGTFSMMGGKISGNTQGVCIGGHYEAFIDDDDAVFTMTGGAISDNDRGLDYFPSPGVTIGAFATFNLGGTAVISNNKGGGVEVTSATLNMSGSAVVSNHASFGVSIYDDGWSMNAPRCTMTGGIISGNNIGVEASDSTFTMTGGEISGNGTGVDADGTFTMSGAAQISNNERAGISVVGTFNMNGGAINYNGSAGVDIGSPYIGKRNAKFNLTNGQIIGNSTGVLLFGNDSASDATFPEFNMSGGIINENTNEGVNVRYSGIFNMRSGEISGNTVGVILQSHTDATSPEFNMSGGSICENYGNGVEVQYYSAFTMSGGRISGNTGYGVNGMYGMYYFNVRGKPVVNDAVSGVAIQIIDDLQSGARIVVPYTDGIVAKYVGPNRLTELMAKAFASADGTAVGTVDETDGRFVVMEEVAIDNENLKITKFISPSGANYFTTTSPEGFHTYYYYVPYANASLSVNVEVTEGASWKLYSDAACTNEVINKTLELNVGANNSYIKITSVDNTESRIIRLVLHREDRDSVSDPSALTRRTITFHSGLADARKQNVSMDIIWGWNLFKTNSSTFNNNLAIAGLALSEAVNTSYFSADHMLGDLNFGTSLVGNKKYDVEHYDYGFGALNAAHTIALQEVTIDGNQHNLIVIIARGTSDPGDIINDLLPGIVFASAQNVVSNLSTLLSRNGISLNDPNNKFFITGHSLGGAVANIVGENISRTVSKSNTYVYTFAAFKTTYNRDNWSNIHNIVNKEDIVPGWTSSFARLRYGVDYEFHRGNANLSTMHGIFYNLCGKTLNSIMDASTIWIWEGIAQDTTKLLTSHSTTTYMAYLLAQPEVIELWRYQIRVASFKCPVDVEVYNSQGNLVGRVVNHIPEYTDVFIYVDGDEKYVYMPLDDDYTFKIIATGEGTMDYELYELGIESGEPTTSKLFDDVVLSVGKQMSSEAGEDIEVSDTQLYVIDDTGKKTSEIQTDGTEIPMPQLHLDKSYLVLQKDQSCNLKASYSNGVDATSSVAWKSSNESVATVTDIGLVTAMGAGTAIITAYNDEYGLAAECRVDVTEAAVSETVRAVNLLQKTVTSNVLSTNYVRVPLQLELDQNKPVQPSAATVQAANSAGPTPHSIDVVTLLNDSNSYFTAKIVDDRFVELIPNENIVTATKVKQLKTELEVTVDGKAFKTPVLTIKITRTKPKLKAAKVSFNTFFPNAAIPVSITSTSGAVTSTELAEKNDYAKVGFNATAGTLTLNSGQKPKKLVFNVGVEGFTGTYPVNMAVAVAKKDPAVKLSASSVTMRQSATLRLTGNDVGRIQDVTIADNSLYAVSPIDASGNFQLSYTGEGDVPAKTSLNLKLSFVDTDQTRTLKLTVKKPGKTSVKLAKKTVTLNKQFPDDYIIVDYTTTPVDAGVQPASGATDMVNITVSAGQVRVSLTDAAVAGKSYKVKIGNATLTVKAVDKEPVIKLKAKGTLNVLDPNSAITLTPTFTSYNYQGATVTVDNPNFEMVGVNAKGVATLRLKDAAAKPRTKQSVTLTYTDARGSFASKAINITPKQPAPKFILNAKQVTLQKNDVYSEGQVGIALKSPVAARIVGVKIKGEAHNALYEIREIQNGRYAIGFKDNTIGNVKKGATITLEVRLYGSDKPGSVKVKVVVQ